MCQHCPVLNQVLNQGNVRNSFRDCHSSWSFRTGAHPESWHTSTSSHLSTSKSVMVSWWFMIWYGVLIFGVFNMQQALQTALKVQGLNPLDHWLWEMISVQVILTCWKILERTLHVKRFHWVPRLCFLVLSQDMASFLQGVSCFLVRIFEGATGTTRVSIENLICTLHLHLSDPHIMPFYHLSTIRRVAIHETLCSAAPLLSGPAIFCHEGV